MPVGRVLTFGPFRLDRGDGRLWHEDVERPLRGKSFAVLRYLAEHPGRLVPRDELLRAVWPGVAVSASVVRVSIREVRDALGDDALRPRFLETVGRQGYRFLAPADAAAARPPFVGRAADLAQLHLRLERCRGWSRQAVFVTGEPGIGKTTLVSHFVDEVRGAQLGRVAQGHCVELHGAAEPYMAVLELLGGLCRDDVGGEVADALERWAPSWLLQMPGVASDAAMAAIRRRVPIPTRERMMRELADAVDALAGDLPLVIVLEDLHWSDASTVDLLAYVACRASPGRVLIVATYRPVEAVLRAHPIGATARDLIGRGQAAEMALELLTTDDVNAFLARALPGAPVGADLAAMLRARTDGNPLFLARLIEHLRERDELRVDDGAWRLSGTAAAVPPSLRELVHSALDALDPREHAVLAAASAMGVAFDAVGVAAASGLVRHAVETTCARLAERGQLVRSNGTAAWPDGAVGGAFTFIHALHREVIYQRLAPAEQLRLHRALGSRLASGWASDATPILAILASHFERGAEWPRAARFHLAAANGAKLRLADREVVAHSRAALAALEHLAPSPRRDEMEMSAALELASALIAVRGYGVAEADPLFGRARDLAVALAQPVVEMLACGGQFTTRIMRGDHPAAVEAAAELLAMAERFPSPLFVVIGNSASGSLRYNFGELAVAREHFARARAAWTPELPRLHLDQPVLFLGIGALNLQQLGDAEATEESRRALIEYTSAIEDPLNTAHAFHLLSELALWAGDVSGTTMWADRALALATEHGFPARAAISILTKGRALGDLEMQRRGLAALHTAGQGVGMPMYRLGLVETLLTHGRVDEARQELALAFAWVQRTGEARHLAELHRAAAAIALRGGDRAAAATGLADALAVARAQGAEFFAARARADLDALRAG